MFLVLFLIVLDSEMKLSTAFSVKNPTRSFGLSRFNPKFLVPPQMFLGSDPVWRSCEDLLVSQGLLNDVVVMGATTTLADMIAQFSQQISNNGGEDITRFRFNHELISFMDIARVQKFSMFGLADGVVSHTWVYTLATLIQGHSLSDIISSIFADSMIYTPLWCVWFLSAMATLDKRCVQSFIQSFKSEWLSLIRISLGFYVPLNCLVYSFIPVEFRVTAFALGSLFYTIAVSLWSSTKSRDPPVDVWNSPLTNTPDAFVEADGNLYIDA